MVEKISWKALDKIAVPSMVLEKNKSSLYDLHFIFYTLYDPTVNSVSNFRYHQMSTVAPCLPRSLCSASQVHPRITHQLLRSAEFIKKNSSGQLPHARPLPPRRPCQPRRSPHRLLLLSTGWAFQELAAPMDDPGAADPAARHHLSPQPVTRP